MTKNLKIILVIAIIAAAAGGVWLVFGQANSGTFLIGVGKNTPVTPIVSTVTPVGSSTRQSRDKLLNQLKQPFASEIGTYRPSSINQQIFTVCDSVSDCNTKIYNAQPGDYVYLDRDLNTSMGGDHINVSSPNSGTNSKTITFDCGYHILDNIRIVMWDDFVNFKNCVMIGDGSSERAIDVYSPGNVKIENIAVGNWGRGINVNYVENPDYNGAVSIKNFLGQDNDFGMYLRSSTLQSIRLQDSKSCGALDHDIMTVGEDSAILANNITCDQQKSEITCNHPCP